MQHLTSGIALQNGKYRIERVLGQGGFGITYLATDTTTNAYVAIKELFVKELSSRDEETLCITSSGSSDLMTNIRRKFLKESQMLKQLRHPNIVRVYDSFEENGTAYYVMEYIQGISLDEHLKTKGVLSERAAIATIKKVARAVEYLHGRSINHFDIKPANILLRASDKEVILIDFGTAKHYDYAGNATTLSPAAYSQGYAPTELYEQGGVNTFSPETDIYSLGATLYKMLSGITPPSATAIARNGLDLPESINCLRLAKVISRAMSMRKEDRYSSVHTFIEDCTTKQKSSSPMGLIIAIILAIAGFIGYFVYDQATHTDVKITTFWWGGQWNSTYLEQNGCSIEIDGKPYSQLTPCTINLSKGTHSIKVTKEDFVTCTKSFNTDVLKDGELRVDIDYKYKWEGKTIRAYYYFKNYEWLSGEYAAYVYSRTTKEGTREYRFKEINQGGNEETYAISFGSYKCKGIYYNACVRISDVCMAYMNL